MSFFDISSDVMLGFSWNMAFITQSLRGGEREAPTYRPGGDEENQERGWEDRSVICGDNNLDPWETCEFYADPSGSGSYSSWCRWWWICNSSCQCIDPLNPPVDWSSTWAGWNGGWDPNNNGISNGNGSLTWSKLSCRTLYTVHSWAPAKLDIHIQAYQNWFPVSLPAWWTYGEVASVWLNGSNDIQQVWIGANGIGTKEKMAVWLYTAASHIKYPDWSQLPCTNTNFEVKQNPAQYCGDGEVQIRNNEQCENVPGLECDNGGSCDNNCQCAVLPFIDLEVSQTVTWPNNTLYTVNIINKWNTKSKQFSLREYFIVRDQALHLQSSASRVRYTLDPGESISKTSDFSSFFLWSEHHHYAELCDYNEQQPRFNNPKDPDDIDSKPCNRILNNSVGNTFDPNPTHVMEDDESKL